MKHQPRRHHAAITRRAHSADTRRGAGSLVAVLATVAATAGLVPSAAAAADGWSARASMPTARERLAATTGADGTIYAIGGFGTSRLSVVEAYDPTTDTWSTRAAMPTVRMNPAAATGADGTVYAIGGIDGSRLSTVEAYDPTTDSWSARAVMPTAREGLAAVTGADGTVYAIGGSSNSEFHVTTVEAYDPATDTWATRAAMPTARRGLAAVAGPDGKIYAIGGQQDGSGSAMATVEAYDPATDTWSTATAMPTARSSLAAAVGPDGKIYAIGGFNGAVLSTVDAYEPATDTWSTAAAMSTARVSLAATTGADGTIYALGGRSTGAVLLASVEAYTSGAELPTADLVVNAATPSNPTPRQGDAVDYMLDVSNNGPNPADEVRLEFTLPDGLRFDSVNTTPEATCSTPPAGESGTITCTRPQLAFVPWSLTVRTTVTSDATGTLTTLAEVSSLGTPDPNPANNTLSNSIVVTSPEATVSPASIDFGDQPVGTTSASRTVTVSNSGNGDLHVGDVTVSDPNFDVLSNDCTPSPAVGPGESCDMAVIFEPTTTGDRSATLEIAHDAAGGPLTVALSGTGVDASADLAVSASASPNPVKSGGSITYTVSVVNHGPQAAESVRLSDVLPNGVQFSTIVVPAGWACTTPVVGQTGAIVCTVSSLGLEATDTFTITGKVVLKGKTTTLQNTAETGSGTNDPSAANNSATVSTTVKGGNPR